MRSILDRTSDPVHGCRGSRAAWEEIRPNGEFLDIRIGRSALSQSFLFERPASGERALLVRMRIAGSETGPSEEFFQLASAAGLEHVALVEGARSAPDPGHFVGAGKLEEIGVLAAQTDSTLIVFDHELSAIQERNLEGELDRRVIDRTQLILDIFARRARTHEGKLQVELAQLRHASTRLVRGWTHLDRQRGGIGLRGAGESQIELDQRMINQRIRAVERQLSKVRRGRRLGRRSRARAKVPTIVLVGYTNAGKSSLFNVLTDAGVDTADQLFATLDPTLRRTTVPGIGTVVLADTVGFIGRLPHKLVEAFKATLEEVAEAKLLLHVVDAAAETRDQQMADVDKVLVEIGAADVPRLEIFNKVDLLCGCSSRTDRDAGELSRVWVSALRGLGLDQLRAAIAERLGVSAWAELILSPHHGALRSWLYDRQAVLDEEVERDGSYRLRVHLPADELERVASRRGVVLRGGEGAHRMRHSVGALRR
ncbi:MAG: ribosome rescue GTPase HflX [Pseudomonadales bacterium]